MRYELKQKLDMCMLHHVVDDYNCYENCKKIIRSFELSISSPVDIYNEAVKYVIDKLEI